MKGTPYNQGDDADNNNSNNSNDDKGNIVQKRV